MTDFFKPSGNPDKKTVGIGMPASLYLHEFGRMLFDAFDSEMPYQVGSSLMGNGWRDVDIRVMLSKEKYEAMGFGDPTQQHQNAKWAAYCAAFSELGRRITGLPIDFQIQEVDIANLEHKGSRSALVFGIHRRQQAR